MWVRPYHVRKVDCTSWVKYLDIDIYINIKYLEIGGVKSVF